MPHIRICSRCSFDYAKNREDHQWPPPGMFTAKYKAMRVSQDHRTHPDPELAGFWIQSSWEEVNGVRQYVNRYLACDACVTPEAKAAMDYYPEGWTELSKEEWVAKDIEKSCVIS